MLEPDPVITCIDCGGRAHLLSQPDVDPEDAGAERWRRATSSATAARTASTAGTSSSTTTPSRTPDPDRDGARASSGRSGAGEELGVLLGEEEVELVEEGGVVGEHGVGVDDLERRRPGQARRARGRGATRPGAGRCGPSGRCSSSCPRRAARGRPRPARSRRSTRRAPRAAGCRRRARRRGVVTSQHCEPWPPAADAAAQLVELGDAEAVGVEDHHHRRVGRRRRRPRSPSWRRARRARRVRNALHHLLLLGRRHPPVQQPEPQPGQLVRPAAGRTSPRPTRPRASRTPRSAGTRRRPGGPAATSARTAAHASASSSGPSAQRVHDRRAPRRQLVEHAHVEVAVHGHRRRARDRRRRHHEHVGHRRPRPCPAARPAARRRSGAARRSRRRRGGGTSTPSWIRAWVPMTMSIAAVGEPAEHAACARCR